MKCLVWQFRALKQPFKQELVWETRLFMRIISGVRWSDPNVLMGWSDPNVCSRPTLMFMFSDCRVHWGYRPLAHRCWRPVALDPAQITLEKSRDSLLNFHSLLLAPKTN